MSKGSPYVPLRVSEQLLREIDAAIATANHSRTEEPYDRSSWIRSAIRERLAKLQRGRAPKKRRAARQREGKDHYS